MLVLSIEITPHAVHTRMPLVVAPVFFALVVFRSYSTVWARARISNYMRLALAVIVGILASDAVTILMHYTHTHMIAFTCLYAQNVFIALMAVRFARSILRDMFYLLDCSRQLSDPATSRILVYGAGIRYDAFRRELVRSASRNNRVIVGIIDDDLLLRGHYIGGIKVFGTLAHAKRVARELRADAAVIACQLTPTRLKLARNVFKAAGLKISTWSCEEKEMTENGEVQP
jgi:FlaA1/EpsC-like NDP-sugar epimerase